MSKILKLHDMCTYIVGFAKKMNIKFHANLGLNKKLKITKKLFNVLKDL